MPNWFNRELKLPNIKHSVFDLSNDYKTSMRIGYATPISALPVLPSDRLLSFSNETFIRFAPLKFPTMHKIKVHTSNFFVPFRIVLGENNYEDWLNGKKNIVPAIFSMPHATVNPFINTLLDYIGIDVVQNKYTEGNYDYIKVDNPMAILGYFCIIRDWYMDSNIQSDDLSAVDTLIDNYRSAFESQSASFAVSWSNFQFGLFNVSYSKDYFNTARPQPQLGSQMYVLNGPITTNFRNSSPTGLGVSGLDGKLYAVDPYTELSDTTTIRDLWKKEMMQRYLEIDNTFGSRIREKLAGHFGVRYSDQRIQIPMYCGGSSSFAQISEVVSHSDTDGAALGQYAGKAIVADRSKNMKEYFEEHGYFITLLSLVPDNGYCNGQDRDFFKTNIYDFASPEFNNVGWQDVYKGELFGMASVHNKDTWGYQPRYSEYRSRPSRCTGNFRTDEALSYHLNRNFTSLPPLNGNFLKVADTDRIFSAADITGQFCPLYVDVYFHIKMSRPISYEPDSMHLY